MNSIPVIEINNLSFTYGCHPVLRDITLTISQGEAVGITGPNGAGKTTLLKIILGQLKPQSGEVMIFGMPACAGQWRKRVSYVSQRATHFNQGFPASVQEVVMSGRTGRRGIFNSLDAVDRHAAEEAMHTMDIYALRKDPVASLSGGQQQRVFIARALAAAPDLLIMDEPTVGVDTASIRNLYSALKEVNRNKGITLVVVSHDQEGLAGIITRQVCLNLHLCTCNSGEVSPERVADCNCAGLISLRP